VDQRDVENAAALFSIFGLLCALSMAHTIRFGAINRMASSFGMLLLPVVAALVWRLSISVGWFWTVVLFLGLSMVASAMGTVYARKKGIPALFALQPWLGGAALLCAMVAWVLKAG